MWDIVLVNGYYLIETIGIISFALSGVLSAKQKNFDAVGVYIVACVTAFGGGTIRDVILDIQPVYWISHAEYPLALLVMVIVFSLLKNFNIKENWLFVPDSIGLAFIATTSAQTAFEAELPFIVVAIIATIVACFGGIIRDILCQQVPAVFQRTTPIYASIAFGGSYLLIALNMFTDLGSSINMFIVAISIFMVRMLAKKYHIVLKL
ncbi:hypothetical protein DID76_04115 [Candidatus Marinamargulisbacteria bacterium SCGC AG-414-C22]|nr:hypothetical protein DID76_04115 [Candidatus Marinamargulisbacteria bacterium SCGC AG-414-C22]